MNGKKASLLIAEHNSHITTMFGPVFSKLPAKVASVDSGNALLASIRASVPDLLIVDACLSNPGAIDLCRMVKSEVSKSSVPILLLGCPNEDVDVSAAVDAGADDILVAPVAPHVLGARLRSLLRLKFLMDELDNAERVLYTLTRTIEAKDSYTMGHADRVGQYAQELGRRMGVTSGELDILFKGGLLHDIGKIAIPDAILLNPGRFTPEEFAVMKKHPVLGCEICEKLRSVKDALPLIRHHHEKLDGTGYPDGLGAPGISPLIRALSIVDVYDALRSKRSYKDAFSIDEALRILWQEADKGWWDKDILRLWEEIVRDPKPHAFPI